MTNTSDTQCLCAFCVDETRGFFANAMAPWLSIAMLLMSVKCFLAPKSHSRACSHSDSLTACVKSIYSVSVKDNTIVTCFLEF